MSSTGAFSLNAARKARGKKDTAAPTAATATTAAVISDWIRAKDRQEASLPTA